MAIVGVVLMLKLIIYVGMIMLLLFIFNKVSLLKITATR